MSLRQIADEALRLAEPDRAALAAALIESLGSEAEELAQDDWDSVIRARLDELDRGDVTLIPWDKARRRIAESIDGDAD